MTSPEEERAREVAGPLAKRMATHFGEGPDDTCPACTRILLEALLAHGLAERRAAVEECAKVVDERARQFAYGGSAVTDYGSVAFAECNNLANRIRSLAPADGKEGE